MMYYNIIMNILFNVIIFKSWLIYEFITMILFVYLYIFFMIVYYDGSFVLILCFNFYVFFRSRAVDCYKRCYLFSQRFYGTVLHIKKRQSHLIFMFVWRFFCIVIRWSFFIVIHVIDLMTNWIIFIWRLLFNKWTT